LIFDNESAVFELDFCSFDWQLKKKNRKYNDVFLFMETLLAENKMPYNVD
jgi:hypothetical protein